MKFTEFNHPECDTTFYVRYSFEQDVADVDYCPGCGGTGRFEKEGVTEMQGLIVSKSDIVED